MRMNAKGKELDMVGSCYFNNFGVKVYEISENRVRMVGYKQQRMIPDFWQIVDKNYFEERFRDDSKSDYELFLDAINFVDPDFEVEA